VAGVPDDVSPTRSSSTLNECAELASVVFSPLLKKIQIFVDLAEKIAEVMTPLFVHDNILTRTSLHRPIHTPKWRSRYSVQRIG